MIISLLKLKLKLISHHYSVFIYLSYFSLNTTAKTDEKCIPKRILCMLIYDTKRWMFYVFIMHNSDDEDYSKKIIKKQTTYRRESWSRTRIYNF